MKRRLALVAWELGAGRGHLEHIRPIVQRLLAGGWSIVAAVRNLPAAHAILGTINGVGKDRLAIGQAPMFTESARRPARPPSSLAEILDAAGFGDPLRVHPVVDAWMELVTAIKPSIVLADFAPSAVAAVYGRVPTVVIGNGWTIPPAGSPVPRLDLEPYDKVAAMNAERRIEVALSTAPRLAAQAFTFADLLRGDQRVVLCPKLLDPYGLRRRDPLWIAPNIPLASRRRPSFNGGGVVYLPSGHRAAEPVLEALRKTGIGASIYLNGSKRSDLSGIKVSKTPLDLAALLPGARFAIHHGGLGIATWCLLHGVPQLALPADLEKHLYAAALARVGAGLRLSVNTPSADIAKAIETVQRQVQSGSTKNAWISAGSPDDTIEAIVSACEGCV